MSTLPLLLTWFSPAFPIGSFAYSHGLEWAVEAGDVGDEATLTAWIADVLQWGGGRSDAIVLRHAHRLGAGVGAGLADGLGDGLGNGAGLAGLSALAEAAQPSRERREETMAQGSAFALAGRVWADLGLERVAFPVAVGALAARCGVGEEEAALGFVHAFSANLVGAAVRLVPLGQTAGLRVMAALAPEVAAVVAGTRAAGLDEIGGACFRSDIAAMRHETQYTRLFRT